MYVLYITFYHINPLFTPYPLLSKGRIIGLGIRCLNIWNEVWPLGDAGFKAPVRRSRCQGLRL